MSVSRYKPTGNRTGSPLLAYFPNQIATDGAIMSLRTTVGAVLSRNLALDCRFAVALADNFSTIRSRVSFRHLSGDAAEATEQAVIVFPVHCSEAPENVSILSPLGMALIGEREGSEVEYVAPGGTYRIRIEAVAQQQTPRVLQRE